MSLDISWEQFHDDVRSLVEQISNSGYKPDILVPIMRGGLILSAIIAEELGVKDIRPIDIERVGDERRIVYGIQGGIRDRYLLLLEDAIPTGGSILYAERRYRKRCAEVRKASVYVLPESIGTVDYYARLLDEIPNLQWKPSRRGDRIR